MTTCLASGGGTVEGINYLELLVDRGETCELVWARHEMGRTVSYGKKNWLFRQPLNRPDVIAGGEPRRLAVYQAREKIREKFLAYWKQ